MDGTAWSLVVTSFDEVAGGKKMAAHQKHIRNLRCLSSLPRTHTRAYINIHYTLACKAFLSPHPSGTFAIQLSSVSVLHPYTGFPSSARPLLITLLFSCVLLVLQDISLPLLLHTCLHVHSGAILNHCKVFLSVLLLLLPHLFLAPLFHCPTTLHFVLYLPYPYFFPSSPSPAHLSVSHLFPSPTLRLVIVLLFFFVAFSANCSFCSA